MAMNPDAALPIYYCPQCKAKLRYDPALAGKTVPCPKCGLDISIPVPDDPSPRPEMSRPERKSDVPWVKPAYEQAVATYGRLELSPVQAVVLNVFACIFFFAGLVSLVSSTYSPYSSFTNRFRDEYAASAVANAVEHIAKNPPTGVNWIIAGLLCLLTKEVIRVRKSLRDEQHASSTDRPVESAGH